MNGIKTTHVWDGSNIVMELDGSDNILDKYVRGINLIKNNSSYFLFNAHGDVVHLTDSAGAVTKRYHYDAFGNEVSPSASDGNPWRYCGEYFDGETGTVYLRARYYDPRTGRFGAEDPIGAGLNWYTYCRNNPLMFIDPSGLTPAKLIDLIPKGGSVTWDDKTKTASVTINGETHTYTSGKFGSYINAKEGRMYVELELFNRDFGLNKTNNVPISLDKYSKEAGVDSGVGYSAYSGQTSYKEKTQFGTYVGARSYTVHTFEYTVSGEKVAQAINNDMNQTMGGAKIGLGVAVTYFTWGFSGIAAVAVAGATTVDSWYDNYYADYSYGLEAGDTIIISNYSGSMSGSMAPVGVTTTVTVYDMNGNCKYSGSSYRGR